MTLEEIINSNFWISKCYYVRQKLYPVANTLCASFCGVVVFYVSRFFLELYYFFFVLKNMYKCKVIFFSVASASGYGYKFETFFLHPIKVEDIFWAPHSVLCHVILWVQKRVLCIRKESYHIIKFSFVESFSHPEKLTKTYTYSLPRIYPIVHIHAHIHTHVYTCGIPWHLVTMVMRMRK